MKKYIYTIILLAASMMAMAQDEVNFSADRPGAATGVGVVDFKGVMWESGFQHDYISGAHGILLPTTMFRFGITSSAELRLEYDGVLGSADGKQWTYEMAPMIVGTKVKIFEGSEQHKWIPTASLMLHMAVPCTKTLAESMHLAPSAYLLFQNDVTDWFNIGYNLGVEWDGANTLPNTFVALCLGFNITDNLGAFVESYNYITGYGKNLAGDVNMDFGFNYMVHPRVQLDMYASINCQDPKAYSNVGMGVAWLIR